jgi:excisionase family DNA binding protein
MTRATRDLDKPFTVTDLCRVTGWSRPTVYAAMECGRLPGYQSGPRGKWTIPAAAFRALLNGTWTPQPRELVITNVTPIRTIDTRRAS